MHQIATNPHVKLAKSILLLNSFTPPPISVRETNKTQLNINVKFVFLNFQFDEIMRFQRLFINLNPIISPRNCNTSFILSFIIHMSHNWDSHYIKLYYIPINRFPLSNIICSYDYAGIVCQFIFYQHLKISLQFDIKNHRCHFILRELPIKFIPFI